MIQSYSDGGKELLWKFSQDIPIYIQIIAQVESDIASGFLSPGQKLSSVRELAAQANVNPNTMQKAFTELERKGLVFSQRTSGRYVTNDPERLSCLKTELAEREISSYLSRMERLGFSAEDALHQLSELVKKKE
ncbi:MAG: GntR family transcriptional regulator [Huintestinicola sp.]